MILAQKVEDLLGLGSLREGGVATQVAEHDDNLAAVAFEDLFVTSRDYQFSELRGQKPLQSSDPTQFIDLLSDARLQTPVQFGDLFGARPELGQQPRVLYRDHSLVGKTAHQFDLPICEGLDPTTGEGKRTNRFPLSQQRHADNRPYVPDRRRSRQRVFRVRGDVRDLDSLAFENCATGESVAAWPERKGSQERIPL